MKKDKDLLKRCLQELERIKVTCSVPVRYELIDEVSDYLAQALVPEIEDTTFIDPGDECQCGEFAVVDRITHWSVHTLCRDCAAAYDLATKNQQRWMDGYLIAEAGGDPLEVVS